MDRREPRQGDGARRWWYAIAFGVVIVALVGYVVFERVTHFSATTELAPSEQLPDMRPGSEQPLDPPSAVEVPEVDRMLYSDEDLDGYRSAMGRPGPYVSTGDAGHGGPYSPRDGERAREHAASFLEDPGASLWSQPDLPFSAGDPAPIGMEYARPMFAAWIFMTELDHPARDALGNEVKALLRTHANDPSLDFSDDTNYGVDFPGSAQAPIFLQAQWMSRLIKARDMLGREAFSKEENATFDRWIFGYANWTAHWLHREQYEQALPGRLSRDYRKINWSPSPERRSYDGGPLIGAAGMAYTNRHATVASAMSLAANYLAYHGSVGSTTSEPAYGVYSVDTVVDHSRLFVEETLRFSVWPEGFSGDFERGDDDHHDAPSPQQGWLYSVNVLSSLLEMADFHAVRGDTSLWDYGTTEGYGGSAGAPEVDGFDEKNLHFFAWAMSRYVNDGWERTNRGEPLALPTFYHDVIPAAAVSRFVPDDRLLEAAWKREGAGFPPYPADPQSQGPYHAHHGEGAKMVGLIEHAKGG